ncbi:zincin-like metallopeptidase domain-containing protein [uncultured Roseobacter sp.]|uniref:ArdC family protein n=1 Tax=uncultured Roseobacter sp. TaxID=114847 RepID=UPI0026265B61|nr:zincin-like metallopeptidase domain-containing protein [uncultured Roseobacter sp.]
MKKDIYQKVTNKIIADLKQGELTWLKPWSAGNTDGRIIKPLRHNGQPYNGINVLMLWGAAVDCGFVSPHWMTFKQAKQMGAHVKKGERGNLVVYANTITKTEEQENGEEEERKIPFMKGYSVFNVEQIEGLPEHYYAKPPQVIAPAQRIDHADRFFDALGADIRDGGAKAYYSGASDHVQMPSFQAFRSPESYYATLAHELTHWTKHKSRLDREFGRKKWGDEGYAREELVAELGAAFLCADLALTPEPGTDYAAYIQSWLKVLKNDKRAIFSAAAHAQRAADYLHSLQPLAEEQPKQAEGVAA